MKHYYHQYEKHITAIGLCTLELRPILPAVTPLALLALLLAFPAVTPQHCYDVPPANGKALRAARRACTRSFMACILINIIQQTRRNLKNMNPKNTNKSLIHENADTNITCDFCDRDISRLGVAYLIHVIHTYIHR